MGTLKPQTNVPLYSNTVIGILAVDGWDATFGTARRGLGGLRPKPVYQLHTDVALLPVPIKGLSREDCEWTALFTVIGG